MIYKNDFRTPRERVRGYGQNGRYPDYLMPKVGNRMTNRDMNNNSVTYDNYNARESTAVFNKIQTESRGYAAVNKVSEAATASHPLAMVYSPSQSFDNLFDEENAFIHGSLFKDLVFPFECSGCPSKMHYSEDMK